MFTLFFIFCMIKGDGKMLHVAMFHSKYVIFYGTLINMNCLKGRLVVDYKKKYA